MSNRHPIHTLKKSTLLIASSLSLLLAACDRPGTTTGIAYNPCLNSYWKDKSECQSTAPSTTRQVTGVALHLQDIPDAILKNRLKLPLQAQALLQAFGDLPTGAYVEFSVDGKVVGKANVQQLTALSGMFLELLEPLSAGQHQAVAVLKSPDDTVLATSNVIQFTLPAETPVSQSIVHILTPGRTQVVEAGKTVIIIADAHISANTATPVKVEFYSDSRLLGTGSLNPDGTYRLDFDTSQLQPGTYPLVAVVKDANAQEIARSEVAPLVILAPPSNSLQLGLSNLTGLSQLPIGQTALINGQITSSGNIPSNSKLEFYANGQLIATANVDKQGNYLVEWQTSNLPAADYTLEAKLVSSTGQTLVTSNPLTLALTQNTVASPSPSPLAAEIKLAISASSAAPGDKINLDSTIQISPQDLTNGAYVEYRNGSEVLGRGQQQADGSWRYVWDTQGQNLGNHSVTAVLMSGNGQQLAISPNSTVNLANNPTPQQVLLLIQHRPLP